MYTLKKSLGQHFLKDENIISKIVDELKHHPYIKYKLAKVLINYRNQNGPFKSEEDLKKALDIDDEDMSKILHYISFE